MELFQQIAARIMRSILTALYQPFWGAVSMAFLFMFLFLYGKDKEWSISNCFPKMIQIWYREFRDSSVFRRVFLLSFYSAMILFRTLLNREIWFDPLGKIMEGWGLYDAEGHLTTEAIENFMLFVPFTILLFWAFKNQIFGEKIYLKSVIWSSIKIVGGISCTIEFLQVYFMWEHSNYQIYAITLWAAYVEECYTILCFRLKNMRKSEKEKRG